MNPSTRTVLVLVVLGVALAAAVAIAVAYSGTLQEDDIRQPEVNTNVNGNLGNGSMKPIADETCERQLSSMNNTIAVAGESTDGISSIEEVSIGFPIGAERLTGVTLLKLEKFEDKVSFRFTAKYTGEVHALAINLLDPSGDEASFQAGLQDDDQGYPTGNWIGQPGRGNTKADANGFITIQLVEAAHLLKDNVYHLVIEPTEPISDIDNAIKIRVYNVPIPYQPLNDENPDIPFPDSSVTAFHSSNNGSDWIETGYWPMFIANYDNGKSMGQPYSLAAPWVVYGHRYVGQEIIPHENFVVKKFGFSVAAVGAPKDMLCYEVRDSNNQMMTRGLFVDRGQLTVLTEFVEVELDEPLSLDKDRPYRFVLFSPGSTLQEPYQLYGHEFTYDRTIGYGGLRNLLTISYDSGSTWQRWEDADSIFSLSGQRS